ncbi:MAG: serine hydrolase domain-containing protein [Gemmatimonadales bacterium]
MSRALRPASGGGKALGTALALVALVGVPASRASAQAPRETRARQLLERYLEDQHVPGASAAISRNGRIVWSAGFGMANLELRVPATPETRFRVGSISKALTSVAVAQLWDGGRLDLDVPVQRYVPSFPEKAHPITTRQLGGHLSGLPHYNREDIVNRVHYESVTHALDKFKDRPLLFTPGERFSYSSFGWNLISAVVEGAAGVPFLDYMERRVFEPLGMTRTGPDRYEAVIPDRTAFYVVHPDGKTENGPAVDNSDVWAGGGFLSTAEDLTRFGEGVQGGAVVSQRGRQLLFTRMTTTAGDSTGYGLGWRVRDLDGRRVVGHGGSHVGATAQLLLDPTNRVVVAILTNSNNRGLSDLADDLARLFAER